MKIAIIGDLHGNIDCSTIFNYLTSQKPHDLVIQSGDFGFLWSGNGSDRKLIKKLSSRLRTPLLVIPGNHENYDLIKQLPEVEIYGAKCYQLKPNIFYIKRGEILTINNLNFLTLSGALSIDKLSRQEHTSWWKDELWTKAEEDALLDKLDKFGYENIDYVISHTAPSRIVEEIILTNNKMPSKYRFLVKEKVEDPTTFFFEHLDEKLVNVREWHFGHMHEDIEIGSKYYCHYFKIYELEI